MNVLIVEYFTGGGLCGGNSHAGPSGELRREGDLMLHALARDLGEIAGVRLTTTRDRRLPPPDVAGVVAVRAIREDESWEPRLRELLDEADALWPIAPETGGALAELCELCERSGRLLLNSSAAAVRCAASKRLTARALTQAGLPCVETWDAADAWADRVREDAMVVLKPDDGVGCENMRVVAAARASALSGDGDVVQPHVAGEAASLSVLYGGGEHRLAGVNAQEIERRGDKLSLTACVVNGLRRRAYDFDAMAKRIGQAIPGLAGYVGVDCVVHGGGVCIIEVNPRLTTSYVGLRRSLGVNPAACVISLLTRSSAPRFDLESATAVRVAP